MHHRQSLKIALFLAISLSVFSCGDSSSAVASEPAKTVPAPLTPGPLTPTQTQAAEMPSDPANDDPFWGMFEEAIDADDAVRPLRLEIISEFGYENAEGQLILDVMERDYLYLTLLIQDAEGRPVRGLLPKVTPERDSKFVALAGKDAVSTDAGSYEFGIVGGSMGEERVEITVGEAVETVILNVISLRAAGYGWLGDVEGALDWTLLFQADVEWGEEQLSATFPEAILSKSGKTVKMAGFMLPLEMTRKQSRFVLASNPPGCYFHIPGGPAGAVEVFAKKPLEPSWDPIVLEGRFEALETSETGVLYRLHDARAVDLPPR